MPHNHQSTVAEPKPAALTSLDSEQLSVQPHTDTPDQQIRFKNFQEHRQWLLTILPDLPIPHRLKDRIRACGSSAWVEYSPSRHRIRVAAQTCGNRACPACRAKRAYLLSRRMMNLTASANGYSLKLITLTLRHSKRPLIEQIQALKTAFKKLRSCPDWKAALPTGVAIVEVTRNEDTGDWHPHLHILAKAGFIPHEKLKAAWWRCTHTSNIVDIRCIRGASAVARYVTAYLCKPPSDSIRRSPELVQQWFDALQRTHWIIPFGKRGTLPKLPKDDGPNDWEPVGRLAELAASHHPYLSADWAKATLLESLNTYVVAYITGTDDDELALDG